MSNGYAYTDSSGKTYVVVFDKYTSGAKTNDMIIMCQSCRGYYELESKGCVTCQERIYLDRAFKKATLNEPTLPDRL